MNKALDLLRRLENGDNRGDFFIRNELLKEIQELLAQPEQELIDLDKVDKHLEICDKSEDDYINEESGYNRSDWQYHVFPYGLDLTCQPLYLAPPKREPLSEDAIWDALPENPMGCAAFIRGVKFAEKAHGIGVGND